MRDKIPNHRQGTNDYYFAELRDSGNKTTTTTTNNNNNNNNQNNQAIGGVTNEAQKSYFDALKNENYKELLSSEIQLQSARQAALRATQSNMQSLGMANSGYHQTALTGTNTAYLNALQNAQSNYSQRNLEIDLQAQQKQEATDRENFEVLTALMTEASSYGGDAQANVLKSYGLIDDNGNYTQAFYDLNANDRNAISGLRALSQSQENEANWLANNTLNNGMFFAQTSGEAKELFTDEHGKTGKFNKELEKAFADSFTQNLNDGDVLYIEDKNGKSHAYLIWKNNGWYKTTSEVYESAEGAKHQVKGEGNIISLDTNTTKTSIDEDLAKYDKQIGIGDALIYNDRIYLKTNDSKQPWREIGMRELSGIKVYIPKKNGELYLLWNNKYS